MAHSRKEMTGIASMLLVVFCIVASLCVPLSASAEVTPDGWEWQNPLPQGNDLNGVWGTSSSDVFAVGYDWRTAMGVILHYDGESWSFMSSDTGGYRYIDAVWGASSTDVFAVGYDEMVDVGIILHYDGESWSFMKCDTSERLDAIWGSSATDVFAVGYGVILHYDGVRWTRIWTSTSEPVVGLSGVWGSSPSDVYVVGSWSEWQPYAELPTPHGVILHYDGRGWSRMAVEDHGGLQAVWGTSRSHVFAVGNAILHYDGTSWNSIPGTPFEYLFLSGVWGQSPSDVFVVGRGWSPETENINMILHYDGTAWSCTTIGSGVVQHKAVAVWGSPSAGVFAVGDGGTILHRTLEPAPSDPGEPLGEDGTPAPSSGLLWPAILVGLTVAVASGLIILQVRSVLAGANGSGNR